MNLGRSYLPLLVLLALGFAGCSRGSGGNKPGAAPTVTVSEPSADVEVGQSGAVALRYVDDDPDSAALTDLFADMDGNLGSKADQVVLGLDLPEQNGSGQDFFWCTEGVPHGEYRVIARTTDGQTTVTAEAPGRVRVDAAPSVSILAPSSADADVEPGSILIIEYVDDDPDSDALTSIWADGDADLTTTFDRYEIVTAIDGNGTQQSVAWDTSGVPDGFYTLIAETKDELNPAVRGIGPSVVALGQSVIAGWGGGTGDDVAQDVATFSDGSFVIAGHYQQNLYFVNLDGGGDPGGMPTTGQYEGALFIARFNQDGSLAWANAAAFGAEEDEVEGIRVAALADGACVITGRLEEPVIFGLGTPAETTLGSIGRRSFFLARYTVDGQLAWAHEVGGGSSSSIGPSDVVAMPDGSIVVVGSFNGTVDFAGGFSLTTATTKMFMAWYDENGTAFFVRGDGGQPSGNGPRVGPLVAEAASDGSLFVSGILRGSVVLGEGDPNETSISYEAPGGYSSPFVAKYGTDRRLVWVAAETTNTARAFTYGLAPLEDGSVVASGWFEEVFTLGAGQANEVSFDPGDWIGGLLARYDADGLLTWARFAPSSTSHLVGGSCVALADSVVWTGYYYQDATFGPLVLNGGGGYENMFLVGYSLDGEAQWAQDYVGEGVEGHALSRHGNGFIIVGEHSLGFPLGEHAGLPYSIGTDNTSDYDLFYARFGSGGDL